MNKQKCLGPRYEEHLCYNNEKQGWGGSAHTLRNSESPAEAFRESWQVFQQGSDVMKWWFKKNSCRTHLKLYEWECVFGRRGGRWEGEASVCTSWRK